MGGGPRLGGPSGRRGATPARSWNSVCVKPGSTVVTVTPVPASSLDTASPNMATNPLVAP
jgi:hypothetical protein